MAYQTNALGQPWLTDPTNAIISEKVIGAITQSQQAAIRAAVADFPAKLKQAKRDYYIYKAGLKAGLFPWTDNTKRVRTWFTAFPRLWQAIRPNYEMPTTPAGLIISHAAAVKSEADAFVKELDADVQIRNSLGIAPIIVAGVLIAGVAGIAGAIWAIGYSKEQANITKIIDQVTAGKLPASVLNQALVNASAPGLFGNLGDLAKWGAIGLAVWFGAPIVSGFFKRKGASA